VALFHRMMFGQKAERVIRDAVERHWREFLEEQERAARGLPTNEPTQTGAAKSVQLLLLLGGTANAVQDARSALAFGPEALAIRGWRPRSHAQPTRGRDCAAPV
jgi:hypothetical protein